MRMYGANCEPVATRLVRDARLAKKVPCDAKKARYSEIIAVRRAYYHAGVIQGPAEVLVFSAR